MKKIAIAAAIVLAPALAGAQSTAQVQVQSQMQVHASGSPRQRAAQRTEAKERPRLSADAQAKVDANVKAARARHLPEQPIRDRVAEGEAKGASDAQIVAASGRTLVTLETSFDAMVRAGRTQPSDAEVTRGSQLVARGFTSAQIEAVARRAPSDRSLVVAFETLTSLQAKGTSTSDASARVEQMLAARVSDARMHELAVNASAAGQVGGALGHGAANGEANGAAVGSAGAGAGSAAAGAGAAAAGALGQGGAGAGAGVAGTVGGVLHHP